MSKRKKRTPSLPIAISRDMSGRSFPFPTRHLWAIGLMGIIGLLAYSNTFHVPFQFDDVPNISGNPSVLITDFSFEALGELIRQNYSNSIRFFAYFTFALNYYFGGINVFGYHLVNLLIHISSSLAFYWLLLLTFNLPSLKPRCGSRAFPIALFSSLLFLSHPIQTQSVTYIVQRMASMGGMFYLLAMALYVKGRLSSGSQRQLCWAGAVSSYLLGLFTKENVAILPLFVALYEFFFFQNVSFSPKGKKALTYVFGAVVLIGLLWLLLWGKRYYEVILEGYKIRDFTLTERVLTQFRVVLYYLTLLIFPIPSRLNLDYDFSISRGLFDPWTTLVSILIVGGLVGLSIWKARRRPLLSFFTLWYFGNLVVESSIFPLEMVYEHRLYLPMVGPVVLFVVGVITGWEKFSERLRLRSRLREDTTRVCGAGATGGWREWPLWGFFSLLVILFVFGSCERNKVWRDAVTLWEDCVKKSPQKPRAHNNLGYYLVKVKNFQRGIEELKFALKLNPSYNDARFNLGVAYGEMNQLDQAETNLEEYLRLAPKDPEGYNEIGLVYLKKKRTKEAVESFKKGMAVKPSVAKLHANLGNAYFQLGLIDEAISEFKRAMALHLNLASIHVNLAEAYQKKGRPDLAMQEIEKALRMDPSLNEALVFRGAALVREGKIDQGISELERALKVNPKDPGAYNNLGVAYRKKKRLDEAIVNYKKALDLDPSFSDARINLGEIYFERGQVEAAISEFKNTISFDPRKAEAHNNMGAVYLNKRNFDEAISNFKSALAINPKYGDAHFNLAVAYYYKKDFLSATTHAEKALELGYEVDPRLLKALGISR